MAPYDEKKYSWRRTGGRKAPRLTEEERGSRAFRKGEHNKNQRALYGERPSSTHYNAGHHPDDIINWFKARYDEIDDPVEVWTKQGELKFVQPPAKFPSFSGYAMENNCSVRTLLDWRTRYPEFDEACMRCLAIEEEAMVQLGSTGGCVPTFAILMMKNRANWTEKGEVNHKAGVTIVFDEQDKDA